MSDFDYGNARLRAMKSRLLARQTLEELAGAATVRGLIAALAGTPYRDAIQAALVRLSGLACIGEALRDDLTRTLGCARAFFSGAEGELVGLALSRYDVNNVKTILRGLSARAPAGEIVEGTLPVGELRPADIARLAGAADVHTAVEMMLTWGLALARPLLDLRADRGNRPAGAGLFEMEMALERWYFRTAEKGAGDTALREMVAIEADLSNILTALRLVGVADAASVLSQQTGAGDVAQLFVSAGRLPAARLSEAAGQQAVADAVRLFADSPYGPALSSGWDDYRASSRLSAFERALSLLHLRHASGLIVRDPLGIGVLLGYAALKTNEVSNLRAIAHGVVLGDPPDLIRAGLMHVE